MQNPYSPETDNLNQDSMFSIQESAQNQSNTQNTFFKETAMNDYPVRIILPPQFIGDAAHGDDGVIRIGTPRSDGSGVVEIQLMKRGKPQWWGTNTVQVYVCRWEDDLSIAEIHMAQHDGLFDAELEYQNELAEKHPLGRKEYWRSELVGKATNGLDNHLLTNEEFEEDWHEFEEGCFDDDSEDIDD